MSSIPPILTVSALNELAGKVIETYFSQLRVEGEITNWTRAHSGHWYFSIKDATAEVRCVFFRTHQNKLAPGFVPQNGMHVLLQAVGNLYRPKGEFQLVVHHLEEKGEGSLRRAYEKLKAALAKEGLFDPRHKKTLPPFPHCIGVITSTEGAAMHDVINILRRRFPLAPVRLYHAAVQGDQAESQIVNALRKANEDQFCDVVILCRGGGSFEDLNAFNAEAVARAIFASAIPIVTGIGHDVDETIADFVADFHAPTPSAAAELVSPDPLKLEQKLGHFRKQLDQQLERELGRQRFRYQTLRKQLDREHPYRRWQEYAAKLDRLSHTLTVWQKTYFEHVRQQLQRYFAMLQTLSPWETLKRGYACLRDTDQKLIRSCAQVTLGETVIARVSDGSLVCGVQQIKPNSTPDQNR